MATETDSIFARHLQTRISVSNQQPNIDTTSFRWRPLLCLLAIFAVERCSYYNYMSMVINAGNTSLYYCGALEGDIVDDPWWSVLHLQLPASLSFLLPLLGGYLADRWFGCSKVLLFGFIAYHIGAWMLVALVHWPAACSTGLAYTCKAVFVSASGILRPSLLVLTIQSGLEAYSVRHVCQMYYLCESAGQVLGYLLAYGSDNLNYPLGFLCVPTTAVLVLLALGASDRPGWTSLAEEEQPGWARKRRVLIISIPLIVLSWGVLLGYYTLSMSELYRDSPINKTPMQLRLDRHLLLLGYSLTLVVAVAVLMLATRICSAIQSLPDIRIVIGIAAAAFCHLAEPSIALIPSPAIRFLMAGLVKNLLYAIAEAFAISTADEVAYRVAFDSSRTVSMGFFMGLWGSGYVYGTLVELLHREAIDLHLATGALLLVAFAHFAKFGVPALDWLLNAR